MALPVIQQSTSGNSVAANPASIAPSWAASQAGSCLVVVFGAALSGAPTFTPPANWQLATLAVTNGVAIDLRVYYLPGANNAGGITTASWSLANVNGIAWGMYEILNANVVQPQDTFSFRGNTGTSTAASATQYASIHYNNEFWLSACADILAGNITLNNLGGVLPWTVGPAASSAGGATNVNLATASQLQGGAPISAQANYNLSSSVAWSVLSVCFYSTSSGQYGIGEFNGAGGGFAGGIAVSGPNA